MPFGRRQALFAFVFAALLLLGGFALLRHQGLLVLTKSASELAAEADMPNASGRHALEAIAPCGMQPPQTESMAHGPQGRVVAMMSPHVRITDEQGLRWHETDANGNPVLGGTYSLSVPFAFARGDIPI